MNVLTVIDRDGEATNVGLEAQCALQEGDTSRSAQFFKRAGEILESAVARLEKPSERDLARFLAATHYYKGGIYLEAARVCRKIQERRLPSRVRHLYPPFLTDVKERSAPDYAARYTEMVKERYQRVTVEGDRTAAQEVIDLLIAHPYLFPRDRMAHMRARCCDVLGHRRATTLFFRDAWRFNPDNPHYPLAYVDSLCKEGKHAEAWKVVESEFADHPGVRSSICAMLVINAIRIRDGLSDQARGDGEPQASVTELLRHFEAAEVAYRSLAPTERTRIALLIDLAFSIAFVAYLELDDATKQLETLNRWIELRPDRPDPRVFRGMISHPGADSIRDFEMAVRLGSADPWPFYSLAAEALRARDFRECERLARLALERDPDVEIRATLLAWRAISLWHRRSRAARQIRELFDEARRLNPGDSRIESYAQAYEQGAMPPDVSSLLPAGGSAISMERAQRYAMESSRRVLDGMSPTHSGTAA